MLYTIMAPPLPIRYFICRITGAEHSKQFHFSHATKEIRAVHAGSYIPRSVEYNSYSSSRGVHSGNYAARLVKHNSYSGSYAEQAGKHNSYSGSYAARLGKHNSYSGNYTAQVANTTRIQATMPCS